MKFIKITFIAASLAAFLTACGGGGANNAASNAGNAAAKAPTTPEAKPAVTLKPGEVPFDGMSNVGTTAKAGEHILCLDSRAAQEIASKPIADASGIFYNRKMVTPGEFESEIEDFGKKSMVPNAYIIALPKGQKAKVGDIVLTWWQSGGGTFRAIVTEAANPAEPTVRYLGMSPREDKSDKLKPDTFVVLKDAWQPGSMVAVKTADGKSEAAMIIRVNGDKVLIRGFAGKMKVVAKADLTPVASNPNVKAGDKVKAAFFANFDDGVVVSVDAAAGKITVKKEPGTEQKALDFGEVYK